MHPQNPIDLSRFTEEGLYLLDPHGIEIRMTRSFIDSESDKLLIEIEKSADTRFKEILLATCSICTLPKGLCYALRAILPFLNQIDKFRSYDRLTALFRDPKGTLHISQTDMQNALQYISVLSLVTYCKAGQKYTEIFEGINPLMETSQISRELFLRIYRMAKGNSETMRTFIAEFQTNMEILIRNLIERVKQVCRNDAMVNALHKMHIIAGFLEMQLDPQGENLVLKKSNAKK
jgi:hypothetical protein